MVQTCTSLGTWGRQDAVGNNGEGFNATRITRTSRAGAGSRLPTPLAGGSTASFQTAKDYSNETSVKVREAYSDGFLKEGSGLGRKKQGIVTPIEVSLLGSRPHPPALSTVALAD